MCINGGATFEIQEQGKFENSDSQSKCVQTASPSNQPSRVSITNGNETFVKKIPMII